MENGVDTEILSNLIMKKQRITFFILELTEDTERGSGKIIQYIYQ